jgi:hypothetical protein
LRNVLVVQAIFAIGRTGPCSTPGPGHGFVTSCESAEHGKALRWRTAAQAGCGAWKADAAIFKMSPQHRIPEPYSLGRNGALTRAAAGLTFPRH